MPARAAWKGFLQINQLNVPVKAFTAASSGPEIALNQLHRGCGERIRQQKVCPTHGVLAAEEIVSGFEYAQGAYLPVESAELEALYPEDNKAIEVDCFVADAAIDAVYHAGRTASLTPDAPPGQRPFCVLRDGMRAARRQAVARVVIAGNELLVLLRPLGRLLAMTVLEYPQRVRPTADYESEVAGISASPAEQQLVGQLIAAMTEPDLDLARYRDQYMDGLSLLLENRVAELTSQNEDHQAEDEAGVLAALQASLTAAGVSGPHTRMSSRTQRILSEDSALRKLG